MIEFLIANMPILQNFMTLRPPHGLEEAHVVHRLGPDQFRDVPHPSQPKFDLARPSREGFRSISPKIWEEIGNKNYTGCGLEVGAGLEVEVGHTPHHLSLIEADHLAKVSGRYL